MADGLFLAFTHPSRPEFEDEMNRWYTTCHLPEILRLDGITSASRYRSLDPEPDFRYLAAYTLQGEDLHEIVRNIYADGPNRTPTETTRRRPPTAFALYEFVETQHG